MLRTLRAIVDSETKNMINPMSTSQNYSVWLIPISSNGNPDITKAEFVSLYYLYKKFKNSDKKKNEPKSYEIHYLAHEFIAILDYSNESSQVK